LAEVRLQEGETVENALRRFKRQVVQENIIGEVKRHSFYLKPGQKLRVKQALAVNAIGRRLAGSLSRGPASHTAAEQRLTAGEDLSWNAHSRRSRWGVPSPALRQPSGRHGSSVYTTALLAGIPAQLQTRTPEAAPPDSTKREITSVKNGHP
jgi:small subunit ribosomal protein S21